MSLNNKRRPEEALTAYGRTLALGHRDASVWFNKSVVLEMFRRPSEALAAYDRGFDHNDPNDWQTYARIYPVLCRAAEAEVEVEAATRQAHALRG